MDFIETRILAYPTLSVAEQREVQGFVDANPEWDPLLQDVKHLRDTVRAAAQAEADPEDILLAFYVTATHVEPDRTWSPDLQKAFRALETRAASNPRLAGRLQAFRRRILHAESLVDPVQHFESLTSSTTPSAFPRSMDESPTPPASPSDSSHAQEGRTSHGTGDTPGASPDLAGNPGDVDPPGEERSGGVLGWVARWPVALQWTFAAIFFAGCLAGALLGIDRLTRSPLDAFAAVEASETRIEGYRMGASDVVADSDSASADRLFLQALVKLREARSTTAGLFPRYDADALVEAQTYLQEAIDAAEPGSFVGLEARFFLAKSYLAEENVQDARAQLQILARRDSRRAAESVKLLQDLQRVAPVEEPDFQASPYD